MQWTAHRRISPIESGCSSSILCSPASFAAMEVRFLQRVGSVNLILLDKALHRTRNTIANAPSLNDPRPQFAAADLDQRRLDRGLLKVPNLGASTKSRRRSQLGAGIPALATTDTVAI